MCTNNNSPKNEPLGHQLGHNTHGTKAVFQMPVTLASGRGVFICPAVASWSYEGSEKAH